MIIRRITSPGPSEIPYKIAILHTYRSLLRSASYLPDSLARLRVHNEIVTKFRKRRNGPLPSAKDQATALSLLQKQSVKLERAVDLHGKDLSSVLLFTYGRKGTRRRVLMSELLSTPSEDVPGDAHGLEDFISKKQPSKGFSNNAKLVTLIKSQKLYGTHFEGGKIKFLTPTIPKENIWMRPTPVKVVANKEKKFWANLLQKVCPPVDEEDWIRLQKLSMGELQEEAPPRRKSPTLSPPTGGDAAITKLSLEHFTARIRGAREEHDILNTRALRRLYNSIWARSPLMTLDPTTKEWNVQWGHGSTLLRAGSGAVKRAEGSEVEMFEGVEDLQLLPTGKQKKSRKHPKKAMVELEMESRQDRQTEKTFKFS